MKRYIRIHPHRIAVADLEFTGSWKEVDVTDDQLARIQATGQLEVSETPPADLGRAAVMTMDDIVALSQDDKLMPGSSYLAEDTGALIVAADSNGYLTLEPQS